MILAIFFSLRQSIFTHISVIYNVLYIVRTHIFWMEHLLHLPEKTRKRTKCEHYKHIEYFILFSFASFIVRNWIEFLLSTNFCLKIANSQVNKVFCFGYIFEFTNGYWVQLWIIPWAYKSTSANIAIFAILMLHLSYRTKIFVSGSVQIIKFYGILIWFVNVERMCWIGWFVWLNSRDWKDKDAYFNTMHWPEAMFRILSRAKGSKSHFLVLAVKKFTTLIKKVLKTKE